MADPLSDPIMWFWGIIFIGLFTLPFWLIPVLIVRSVRKKDALHQWCMDNDPEYRSRVMAQEQQRKEIAWGLRTSSGEVIRNPGAYLDAVERNKRGW